ncbi:MAG TPA: helix-turn-helix domain-containing protein [Pseudonocardiaceae bacterium]|nr:helix-turn-helix domain-containing protein [Pseudonocardiaceae bacterium]
MRFTDEATVGGRVAFYRRRKGITQEVLAGLLGRSVEWLAQFERGAKELDRLSTIVAIADVLGIEPVKLLPAAFTTRRRVLPDSVIGTAPDSMAAIKSAMLRYNGMATLLDVPDRPPAGHAELAARINEAFIHSQTERWSRLGPLLPDLIADAWHASRTSTGAAQRRAFGQLALVWRVTSGMLDRIGEKDLPWIAAERDMAAADRSADELLIAGAAWRLAVVLRHSGRLQESIEVPLAAADALRPHLAQSPQHASLYGALMLKGAVGSATLGDHVAVRDYLRECDRAAELTGDRNDFWLAFGPTNVAIHRVWLAVELGDPTDALRQAAYVDDTTLPSELAERRTSHLITVAWAHYLHRHDDDALAALIAARSAAPEQLMCTHRVHDMLRQMLRRGRRKRRELRDLAEFVGMQ